MTAQIIRLPVVRKRGRKVTKGPKASIAVIYKDPEPPRPLPRSEDECIESLAEAIARSAIRARREKAEYQEWLAAHKEIIVFPEDKRYRSLEEVVRLEAGKTEYEEKSELEISMERLAGRAAARSREILASQGFVDEHELD